MTEEAKELSRMAGEMKRHAAGFDGMFGRDQTVPWNGLKVCVVPPRLQTVRVACEHLRVHLLFFHSTVERAYRASLRDLCGAFVQETAPEHLVPVLETVCAPLAEPPGPGAQERELARWQRIQRMLREDRDLQAEILHASLSMVRDLPRVGRALGVGEFREWLRGAEALEFDADAARTLPRDLTRDRGPWPLEVLAGEIVRRFGAEGIEGGAASVQEVMRYPFEAVLKFCELFPELNSRAAAEELQRRLGIPLTPVRDQGPSRGPYTEH